MQRGGGDSFYDWMDGRWIAIISAVALIGGFFSQKYALTLSEQMGLRGKAKSKIGEPVSEDDLQSLRDEQVVQLYELLLAAKGEPSDPDPQGGGATTARKKQEWII